MSLSKENSPLELNFVLFFDIQVAIGDFSSSGNILYYDSNKVLISTVAAIHTAKINFLKYLCNENLNYVASSSSDSTIIIWDLATWTLVQKYTGHTNEVYGLNQIDDDTLVSGSSDKMVNIWKISTGATLKTFNAGTTVFSVRVLLLREQIVFGYGSSGQLDIINYSSMTVANSLVEHTDVIFSIEVLSENFIGSGSKDTKVIIWDLNTNAKKYTLTGHTQSVTCLKRLTGNLLASAGDDHLIIIWDWLMGTRQFTLNGHSSQIWIGALDLYDEATLVSVSLDRTIKFWNILNGRMVQSLNANIDINAIVMLKKSKNEIFKKIEFSRFKIEAKNFRFRFVEFISK
jgi:WD40 repeat protein